MAYFCIEGAVIKMMRKLMILLASILLLVTAGIVVFSGGSDGDAVDAAQAETAGEISFSPTRKYEGTTYEARGTGNVTTVLLIGYDHKDQGELIPNQEGFIYGGQSDFLLLLVIDHESKQVRQLQFDRDTITPVKFYSKKGAYYGTRKLQICLSHAYGDTQEMNNRNAIWAVENLLGIAGEDDGAQVDLYLSMDITGIDRLNDLLGGVSVPINDDFSYYDPTMIPGTTMTLTGAQAQIYCRQRYYIGDQSNASRMERQHIYMKAATQKLRGLLKKDANYAMELLNGMGVIYDHTRDVNEELDFSFTTETGTPVTDTPTHYLMTNKPLSSIVSLLMRAVEYDVGEVETLPGEHQIGISGHMEFTAEENAGVEWALDALYRPLDSNTDGKDE